MVAEKRQGIIGALVVDHSAAVPTHAPVIHENLAYLTSLIRPGVALISVTPSGDIYVLLGNGVSFVKRQGRWRHLNALLLREKISEYMPAAAAAAAANIVLSLSYERKGALIGIIDEADAAVVAPDYQRTDRANLPLRDLAKQLQISNAAHQTFLRSAATVDGAVLFSKEGAVLDVACMIPSQPTQEVSGRGYTAKAGLVGARSIAARNCSIHGLAIKVSDDGPITVFERGRPVLELG